MKTNLINIEFDPVIHQPGLSKVIKKACATTLLMTDPDRQYELSILVCDDEQIRELNRTYRGIDHSTDVLSFEDCYELPGTDISHLGDIAISYAAAVRQSEAAGHSVEAEFSLLAIHGVLHLLGFDHANSEEKELMWSMQSKCLLELGLDIKTITGDSEYA